MGLAMARELRRRGRAVTLLERAAPGRAASWASAGIIGATVREESDPSLQLRRVSEAMWPEFAATLIAESGLDPEFRLNGCLYLAADEREYAWLQRARVGELLDSRALHDVEPALADGLVGALRVPGGNVEPRRLCRALEIAGRRAGVDICTGAEVVGVTMEGGRVIGVETRDERLSTELVILAAGAWSAELRNVQPLPPVRPQRGQILALDQSSVGIKHVLHTPGDPYFVPRVDGRLVIGATREDAGWDASLTAGGVAWLLNRAMQIVPGLSNSPIVDMWIGFRPLSEDGLPLIGPSAIDGLYF